MNEQMTDHGILHIRNTREHLRFLDLSYCPITNVGMFHMVHCLDKIEGDGTKIDHENGGSFTTLPLSNASGSESTPFLLQNSSSHLDAPESKSSEFLMEDGEWSVERSRNGKRKKYFHQNSTDISRDHTEAKKAIAEADGNECSKWFVRSLNLSFCCQLSGDVSNWLSPHFFPFTSLHFGGCTKISVDGFVSLLCSSPHLTSLNLSFLSVGDEVSSAIAENCPFLVSLDVSHTHVAENGIWRILFGCRQLRDLNVERCTQLTGSDIATSLNRFQCQTQKMYMIKKKFQQSGGKGIQFIDVDMEGDYFDQIEGVCTVGSSNENMDHFAIFEDDSFSREKEENHNNILSSQKKIEQSVSIDHNLFNTAQQMGNPPPSIPAQKKEIEQPGSAVISPVVEGSEVGHIGQSRIEKLNLGGCEVTDADLISIGKICPALSSIDLSSCHSISQTGMALWG